MKQNQQRDAKFSTKNLQASIEARLTVSDSIIHITSNNQHLKHAKDMSGT